jgi:hypothetical protein
VSGDARVEERDLEWSRAEFCQKSLDTSQRPAAADADDRRLGGNNGKLVKGSRLHGSRTDE